MIDYFYITNLLVPQIIFIIIFLFFLNYFKYSRRATRLIAKINICNYSIGLIKRHNYDCQAQAKIDMLQRFINQYESDLLKIIDFNLILQVEDKESKQKNVA